MIVAALLIGLWASAVVLSPAPAGSLALLAPAPLLAFGAWIGWSRSNWVKGFLAAALLLPPLPVAIGNAGPHPALLFAAAGVWAGLVWLRDWRIRSATPLAQSMVLLLVVMVASAIPALLVSGPQVAMGSLARTGLFAIAVYLFLFETQGPGRGVYGQGSRAIRWILGAAFLASLFACLDFYYQLPAPAGYGPQFVWLDTGVLRRAQGLFYEASTLGNFCAFTLILTAVVATRAKSTGVPRLVLAAVGAVAAVALVFSYSRASILCVIVGVATLAVLEGWHLRVRIKWLVLLPAAGIALALVVYRLFPAFAQLYWLRLTASAEFFFAEPNRILSGRIDSWIAAVKLVADHPWYLLSGVGYKTLPYTDLASGAPLVTDNMYLSMLVETGIVGLGAFLWMNAEILRQSYRAARTRDVFGTCIFCFWTGELVQMLSGDLLTYWRVVALYFWVLAIAVRRPGNEHPVS